MMWKLSSSHSADGGIDSARAASAARSRYAERRYSALSLALAKNARVPCCVRRATVNRAARTFARASRSSTLRMSRLLSLVQACVAATEKSEKRATQCGRIRENLGEGGVGLRRSFYVLALPRGRVTMNSLPEPKPALRARTVPPCNSTKRWTRVEPAPSLPRAVQRRAPTVSRAKGV